MTLHVSEEQPITLEFIEGRVKPENEVTVTPQSIPQTIYPPIGTVFNKVNVEKIPSQYIIPTGTKNITENGQGINVAEFEFADVAIPAPVLQSKTVTPTEAQQTIEPDNGYDALSDVIVNSIPSQYIIPTGKIVLSQNDVENVDISQYETADVSVPIDISGTYFGCDKVRITYTASDLTNVIYVNACNALKVFLPSDLQQGGYIVTGFEVISNSFQEGDFVAASGGVDNLYGSRLYAWKWTNGEVVRSYSNFWQNITGNIHTGAIVDIFLLYFK